MRQSTRRTGLLVALVFVAGVGVGVLAARAVQQQRLREMMLGDPAAMRTRLTLFALDKRLGLSAAQRREAQRILDEQAAAYRAALEPSRPQVRALRRDLAKRLAPVLDAAQRQALEQVIAEGERYR